jgi:GDPmannose 4,6-dehydratase
MGRALVLGVNGQDGSYLAQALLQRNDQVVGVGRQPNSRYLHDHPRFTYATADLADERQLEALLRSVAPDRIYHFAAVHGPTGSGFTYEPVFPDMLRVNVGALHVALDYARTCNPGARIFYAGSSKVFPGPLIGQIDESTPTQVSCLYSLGKLAARDLMRLYLRDHGIQATNLILFNHDSPRRPRDYLLPMLAETIARAKLDPRHIVRVRTLDFWADWSAADELMEIVADLGAAPFVAELILASGKTVYARDAVAALFASHGLKAGDHIIEDQPSQLQASAGFQVRIGRLESLARRPSKTVFDVVNALIDALPAGHSRPQSRPRLQEHQA